MIRRKRFTILTTAFILLTLIAISLIYLLSPIKKDLVMLENTPLDFEAYIKSNYPDSVDYDLPNGQIVIGYSITEEDLTNILWSLYISANNLENNGMSIKSMVIDIEPERLILYTNINIINAVSSQVILEFITKVDEDNIILTLDKSQIGRMPLSKNFVMNNLQSLEAEVLQIDVKNYQLILENNIVNIAKISSIALAKDSVKLGAVIYLSSISDILKLIPLK